MFDACMNRIAIFAAVSFGLGLGVAAAQAEMAPHKFTAQWITAAGAPGHDPVVLRMRKEMTLEAVPAHFVVHVSADNQFLLLVNGKRIGFGPSIGDVHHWRYETYDLAPALHTGKNLIAATVWNLGDLAPIRQMSSRLGFVLDPDTMAESAVATNSSWMAKVDAGINFPSKTPGLGDNYYVASPGEQLDAATLDWEWSRAEDTSSGWQPAVSVGGAVTRGVHSESNSWLLVPDTLPAMEVSPAPAGKVVRSSGITGATSFPTGRTEVPANSHVTLLLDRETLTTAFPTFTLSGGKGAKVQVTYAEALLDDAGNKGNRNEIAGKHIIGMTDELLPDGSEARAFTPLDWRTWRYMQIDVTTGAQPLRLDSLSLMFTAFPFEHKARFESDDPGLTDIWNVGWRTARLCAHDAYMDTPYWERLQYVGDTRIQTLISYTNAGDDRLAKQAIEAFHASLLPEGIGQSRYPSRHLQVIQNFSLLWIGMVHDFWYFRDDPGFVAQQIPGIRGELSYFRARLNPDGLPTLTDWWPFVDWATGFEGGDSPMLDGVSASGALFYLEALQNSAEMENALGDRALGQQDTAEAAQVRAAILRRFWSKDEELIADTTELRHFSQQANALAVWLDVIPRTEQKDVVTRIFSATDSGFKLASGQKTLPKEFSPASNYFRFYLAKALVHAGLGDRYIEALAPWRTMLSVGLSTWAEQPEPTRSDSHAWSAHPNIDLLTTVAGIMPATPQFKTVTITPALGPLKHLSVSYPSPHGEIFAEYTVGAAGTSAKVTLPEGVTGTLVWGGKSYPLRSGLNSISLR
jgi:alpha-L-rhamnosidase